MLGKYVFLTSIMKNVFLLVLLSDFCDASLGPNKSNFDLSRELHHVGGDRTAQYSQISVCFRTTWGSR